MNRAERRFLLYCAETYTNLGYTVGRAQEKVLVDTFEVEQGAYWLRSQAIHSLKKPKKEWDGISIILDGIVCVDFDQHDIDSPGELPSTWTEKSRRGWHYFYRLPKDGRSYSCKTGYRLHLDLLVKEAGVASIRRRVMYGGGTASEAETTWFGHVLVAPTNGYQRIHPVDKIPAKDQLPIAPEWVLIGLNQ